MTKCFFIYIFIVECKTVKTNWLSRIILLVKRVKCFWVCAGQNIQMHPSAFASGILKLWANFETRALSVINTWEYCPITFASLVPLIVKVFMS